MASALPIPDLPAARLPAEDWAAQALTWVGSALDAALLAAMQLVVDRMLMPAPEALGELRASADALLTPELEAEPARFFHFPADSFALRPVHERVRRELHRGAAVSRRFESAYVPWRAGDAVVPEDDRVRLEHWCHEPEHRRGTVLALHGFTMGRPRMDAPILMASHWWEAGLDVVLLTLPFHGARTPPEARFSGEHFAVPHVTRLAEAVRRAVHEVRAVELWVREQTQAPVGLLGLSLGGYLAALAAGLWDDHDFVVPIVPPACIGDLAWQFARRSRRGPEAAPAFDHAELRRHHRVHSPLAHPLRTPRERCFIVAGRGDRIVPPEHPHALWRHWGQPGIHWFSGGHLTPFGRSEMAAAVRGHLQGLGLAQA